MRSLRLLPVLCLMGASSLACSVIVPCVTMPDHELGEDVNLCNCDGIDACALRCDPALPCEVLTCGESVQVAAVDCTGNPFCEVSCAGSNLLTLDCTDADLCFANCSNGQVCEVNCDGAAECGAVCALGGECTVTNCEAGACTVHCERESKDGVEGGGTVSCD